MSRQAKYPPELRERAIRMVYEQREHHESQWAAIESVASRMRTTTSLKPATALPATALTRESTGPTSSRSLKSTVVRLGPLNSWPKKSSLVALGSGGNTT